MPAVGDKNIALVQLDLFAATIDASVSFEVHADGIDVKMGAGHLSSRMQRTYSLNSDFRNRKVPDCLGSHLATPQDDVTEERHLIGSSGEQVEALASDIESGGAAFGRRRLLAGLLGSAAAAFAAALVFPVRSLGPRPGKGLKRTAYAGYHYSASPKKHRRVCALIDAAGKGFGE